MASKLSSALPIVIIGAGPGGTATSLFLSAANVPHILLDKATFPRDKICGDALSGKVVEVMNRLDPRMVTDMDADKEAFLGSWGVKFVAPNGKAIDIPFKSDMAGEPHAPGFIATRVDFDHFLVKKLDPNYCQFIQGAEVTELTQRKDCIEVQYKIGEQHHQLKASIVIGAEGDRSVVAKQLGSHKMSPKHYCGGIRAYFDGVKDFHPQSFIELHFLEELLPGYFWIFPMSGGRANVGAGMLSQTISRKKVNLKKQMLKAIAENPTIKDRFASAELMGNIQGWGLPLGSRKVKLSGDRFMLVGDAGSLIDPFTGEGIGNAMMSGMLAAQQASEAVKQNRFDAAFLKQYDHLVYERLWSELKLSHTLQKLCNYPSLFNFVVNKASKNATLRETISCMFEDLDMRSRFRNPLFYLKLLFN